LVVPVSDAVTALGTTVSDLLPVPASPALAPEVTVNLLKTPLSGIGGYVGLHPSPHGEIQARRLYARVVVRVKANDVEDLAAAESAATLALVGANPLNLRSQGIRRIERDDAEGEIFEHQGGGPPQPVGKNVLFNIDYEYRQLPSAPSGMIQVVPVDLLPQIRGDVPRELYAADFESDPLAAFNVFDDSSTSNGPGAWSHDAGPGRVIQTSTISGGSNAFNASERGTLLVLNPGQVAGLPQDWVLHAELGADTGGIGLVRNFQDIDNGCGSFRTTRCNSETTS